MTHFDELGSAGPVYIQYITSVCYFVGGIFGTSMEQKVLVALDGSEQSDYAIRCKYVQ